MSQESNAPTWYSRGYNRLDEEQVRMETAGEPGRFYLKAGTSKYVTFLEDEPFQVREHEFKGADGKFGSHLTCAMGIYGSGENPPPCCEKLGLKHANLLSFFSVIDIDGYKGKRGNQTYILSVYAAKYQTARMLQRERQDETTLIGRRARLSRDGDKSANVGNQIKLVDWETRTGQRTRTLSEQQWRALYGIVTFRGKKLVDLLALAEKEPLKRVALGKIFDLGPITDPDTQKFIPGKIPCFNWTEILAPKTPKDQKILLHGASASSFEDDDEKEKEKGSADAGHSDTSHPLTDGAPF
jgi:hypothetical protein